MVQALPIEHNDPNTSFLHPAGPSPGMVHPLAHLGRPPPIRPLWLKPPEPPPESCSAGSPSLGFAPAELVYGDNLRLPADLIPPREEHASFDDFVKTLKSRIASQHTAPTRATSNQPRRVPKELFNSEYVYVRKDSTNTPLGLLRTGPFKVLDRTEHSVTIETPHGNDTIAWHRTTPAHMDHHVNFNIPNRRGRPRKVVNQKGEV